MDQPVIKPQAGVYDWSWYWKGIAGLLSVPALVLISAFVGFGGLAKEVGIPLSHLIFMVPVIWALPSHLIVVAGIVSGAPWPAIALAVALASIRMLPMTMALIPVIRVPGTKLWHLLAASNMIAVTAWVHTLQRSPDIPKNGRLPYFVGFGGAMMVATTTAASIVHEFSAELPVFVMAALYFLTPIYFATSTWNTARNNAEHIALILGFCLGPVFAISFAQTSILFAGVIGGVVAFAFHRLSQRNRVGG